MNILFLISASVQQAVQHVVTEHADSTRFLTLSEAILYICFYCLHIWVSAAAAKRREGILFVDYFNRYYPQIAARAVVSGFLFWGFSLYPDFISKMTGGFIDVEIPLNKFTSCVGGWSMDSILLSASPYLAKFSPKLFAVFSEDFTAGGPKPTVEEVKKLDEKLDDAIDHPPAPKPPEVKK